MTGRNGPGRARPVAHRAGTALTGAVGTGRESSLSRAAIQLHVDLSRGDSVRLHPVGMQQRGGFVVNETSSMEAGLITWLVAANSEESRRQCLERMRPVCVYVPPRVVVSMVLLNAIFGMM